MRKKMNKVAKIVLMLILCAGFMVVLGRLRFESQMLAYQLERISAAIRSCTEEETLLRQELSALTAPIKVYSYCKDQIGMKKVVTAEAIGIRLKGGAAGFLSPAGSSVAERHREPDGWQDRLAMIFSGRWDRTTRASR